MQKNTHQQLEKLPDGCYPFNADQTRSQTRLALMQKLHRAAPFARDFFYAMLRQKQAINIIRFASGEIDATDKKALAIRSR